MKKLLLGIALVFILGVSVFYLNIYHSYTAYQKLSETDKIEYFLRSPISYMIMKDSLFWVNDIFEAYFRNNKQNCTKRDCSYKI